MISYRCAVLDRRADPREEGGALWFPRQFQGDGRHDNPDDYGCLYASEHALSPVVERLQRFRGRGPVRPTWLRSGRRPYALAVIEIPDDAALLDLDEPRVLVRERLRPSRIATRRRERTRADAAALYGRHPTVVGLRWWSTLESSWINLTLFDRVEHRLKLLDVRELRVVDPLVQEAAEILGLVAE